MDNVFYDRFKDEKGFKERNRDLTNNKQQNNNRQNNNQQGNSDACSNVCSKVKGKKLSEVLLPKDVFLPGGYADEIAMQTRSKIDTTQLRKFFDMIKNVESIEGFENKRNSLFMVVPQVAYSVGRGICPKELYRVIAACVTEESLKDEEDIQVFIDFIESIVAYKKFRETEGRK